MESTFINHLMKDKGLIRPELQQIKSYLKPTRIMPDILQLTNQRQLQCLVFSSSISAVNWFMLSSCGISINDYNELYNAQHNEILNINYPEIVTGHYEEYPYKRYDHHGKPYSKMLYSVKIDDNDISGAEKKYCLSEHEKLASQCEFCRGLGFIQALTFNTELSIDNIPSPVYKIRCFHLSQDSDDYNKYSKKKTLT